MWIRFARVLLVVALATPARLPQIVTVAPDGATRISRLSAAQKAILLPAIQDATGDHSPDLLQAYSVFPEPLTAKGPPAILAISTKVGCGVNPNCIFLVFRQEHDKDVLILDSVAGAYALKENGHHGYRDIVLTNYMGIHSEVDRWCYDGRQYRMEACRR